MENVVLSVFAVESEAFQALSELRMAPIGEGYAVAEAALVKNSGGETSLLDGFNISGNTSDDTAAGIVIGSLVGILGGPLGVLLGAATGALVGSAADTDDAIDTMTAIEVLAGKLYEGEVAVIALVQEDEPAFDAAFQKYDATIVRYDAADIADEVERLKELEDVAAEDAVDKLRAERKEAREERHEERKAKMKARLDEYVEATNRTMGEVQ